MAPRIVLNPHPMTFLGLFPSLWRVQPPIAQPKKPRHGYHLM